MSIPTLEKSGDAISVVHTGDKHVLINVPRSIDELAAATNPRPRGIRQRVAHFLGLYPNL